MIVDLLLFNGSIHMYAQNININFMFYSSSCRGSLNSSNYHEESHLSNSSATIKPISLASKFDCFSDSD